MPLNIYGDSGTSSLATPLQSFLICCSSLRHFLQALQKSPVKPARSSIHNEVAGDAVAHSPKRNACRANSSDRTACAITALYGTQGYSKSEQRDGSQSEVSASGQRGQQRGRQRACSRCALRHRNGAGNVPLFKANGSVRPLLLMRANTCCAGHKRVANEPIESRSGLED